MRYLLDTGILLRLLNRNAAEHAEIRQAVRFLKIQGHEVVTSFQNASEFWNVCTRPATARGGLGLTLSETERGLRTIERIVSLLPDSPDTYLKWKTLLMDHKVHGVQVHDAKLVALMEVHSVGTIVTLNPGDFSRYPAIAVLTPHQIVQAASTP